MMGGERFAASISLFSLRLAPSIYALCPFISSSCSASVMSTVDLTRTVMSVDFFFFFSVFFFCFFVN